MDNKKISTVHIHTDYKFVKGTNRFFGENFENTIFVYNTGKPYTGPYKGEIIFFDWADLDKLIDATAKADLVVLYDLDVIKSRIALLVPKNVKVAWRFFGHELYSRKRDLFLSDKSRAFSGNQKETLFGKLLDYVRHIHGVIKFQGSYTENFEEAIGRIDYMLLLSREEYEFLIKLWPSLPQCIQLSHAEVDEELKLSEDDFRKKNNTIVIGNNRSSYNNHLDVIELIEGSKHKHNYKFALLFNYAGEGEYADAVRKATEGKEIYRLIEDFIPKSEFITFYKSIAALVINGYRQMAYGNIHFALKNGVKIYLNNKNPLLNWLKKEGFRIYSMEEFEADLNNNNLNMDFESARHNVQNLKIFAERYTKNDFQNKIRDEILQ